MEISVSHVTLTSASGVIFMESCMLFTSPLARWPDKLSKVGGSIQSKALNMIEEDVRGEQM